MTVGELLARMSSEELTEWRLMYEKIDPFGETREDIRIGTAFSILVNTLRAAHMKNPTFLKPSDFFFDTEPSPPQSAQQMRMLAQAFAEAKAPKPKRPRPAKPVKPTPTKPQKRTRLYGGR